MLYLTCDSLKSKTEPYLPWFWFIEAPSDESTFSSEYGSISKRGEGEIKNNWICNAKNIKSQE